MIQQSDFGKKGINKSHQSKIFQKIQRFFCETSIQRIENSKIDSIYFLFELGFIQFSEMSQFLSISLCSHFNQYATTIGTLVSDNAAHRHL